MNIDPKKFALRCNRIKMFDMLNAIKREYPEIEKPTDIVKQLLPYSVKIFVHISNFANIQEWCGENCSGPWADFWGYVGLPQEFVFQNKEDAALFAICWGSC